MKIAGAAILLLCGCFPAYAQTPAPAPAAAAPAAATPPGTPATAAQKPKPQPPKVNPLKATYDAIPGAERIAIQSDLFWTGDYNGVTDGEFKDNSIAAVKTYQKRTGGKDTGVLTPEERDALSTSARTKQENVGWRIISDPATGARIGLPEKLMPQAGKGKSGSHWQSARGEVQVDTFRETAPATLAAIYDQYRKDPSRKVAYNVLKGDFFVMSGLQGLKKFYVRAQAKNNEVRGYFLRYDQAMEGIVEPVAVAMSSAFAGFPNANLADVGPAAKRKVEYATGVAISTTGDIVTDREVIDGCQVITVAGYGNADRVADDKTTGLALLRLYGVRGLKPLSLGEPPRGGDVMLVGIADPQAQGGGSAASSARARVNGSSLDSPPALGFAGAAVIDDDTGFAGIVVHRPQVLAGPTSAAGSSAAIVPIDAIRRLVSSQSIAHLQGRASVDFAKDSVVRVICVRK